jgi:hypothetical protein
MIFIDLDILEAKPVILDDVFLMKIPSLPNQRAGLDPLKR